MNFEYRKTKVVKAEVVKITPKIADQMLEKNIGNRKMSHALVREYASYIRDGLWQENGQTIQVTTDGFVVDGQHRLSAIVLADIPVNVLVVTITATDEDGVLDAIGMAIDRNKPRRHTDISGIDSRCDQTAGNLIHSLMPNGGKKSRNTALRTSIYYDLQPSIDAVVFGAPATARLYSRASIRAALALRHYQGYDHVATYKKALNMHMKELPDAWVSWWRQVGQIEGNNQDSRIKLLGITWETTNPDKSDRSRITLRQDTIDRNIKEMTEVFYEACLKSIISVEKETHVTKGEDKKLRFKDDKDLI